MRFLQLQNLVSVAPCMVFKWDMAKVTVPVKVANPELTLKVMDKLKEIRQLERDAAAKK